MAHSRRLALAVAAISSTLAACGGGNTASKLATAPQFEPKDQTKCGVTKSQARPLIVEWPSADRQELESKVHEGLVVVRYQGCEMDVLERCTVPARYGYRATTLAQDQVVMRDDDDLYANLPVGAAKLEGKLQRAGQLTVDMDLVGRYEAERSSVRSDELQGDCAGATHFVYGMAVGAFDFYAGANAKVGGGVGVAGIGAGGQSSADRETLTRNGDPAACQKASPGDVSPPSQCGALIRIEVVPLDQARASTPEAPTSAAPSAVMATSALARAVDARTLANGLRVFVHEDHRRPEVSLTVTYLAGPSRTPAAKMTAPWLAAEAATRAVGWKALSGKTIDDYARDAKWAWNSAALPDELRLQLTVPATGLDTAMALHAEAMANLSSSIDDAALQSARTHLKEYVARLAAAPLGNLNAFLAQNVYPPGHPYHAAYLSTDVDVAALATQDARKYVNDWLEPRNAVLVIAGDVQTQSALAAAERAFASVPSGTLPAAPAALAVSMHGETRAEFAANVPAPVVVVEWPTAAWFKSGDAQLDMAGAILSARLQSTLVNGSFAAEKATAYQSSSLVQSTFAVNVAATGGHTASELLAAIDAAVAQLSTTPPSGEELDAARKSLQLDWSNIDDRAASINLGRWVIGGGPADMVEANNQRYASITPEDVRNAARVFLRPDARLVAVVKPDPGAPAGGKAVSTAKRTK